MRGLSLVTNLDILGDQEGAVVSYREDVFNMGSG